MGAPFNEQLADIEKPLDDSGSTDNLNDFKQDLISLDSNDNQVKQHPVIVTYGNPVFNECLVAQSGAELKQQDISNYLVVPACLLGSDEPVNYCCIMPEQKPVYVYGNHSNYSQRGFFGFNLAAGQIPSYVFVVHEIEAAFKLSACKLPCVLIPPVTGTKQPIPIDNQALQSRYKGIISALEAQGVQVYAPVPAHEKGSLKTLLRGNNAHVLALQEAISQYSDKRLLIGELAELKTLADQQAKKAILDSWREPLPLYASVIGEVDSYPIDAFPTIVRRAIEKSAFYHKVPLAVAGQTYLATMAYIAQQYINAPSDKGQNGQPCSLAILTIFPSGEGKDVCKDDAAKIAKESDHINMENYNNELHNWVSQKREEKGDRPVNPQSLFVRATTQGILKHMAASLTRSFIWSTGEGAYLLGGHSFNSETKGDSLATLTDLVDKGFVSTNLGGEGSGYISNKRFSLDIAAQDVIARPALNSPLFRHQGFFSRFLFAAPEPLKNVVITKEDRKLKAYLDPDLINYWDYCKGLLDPVNQVIDTQERQIIQKLDEADDVHIEYENFINKEAQEGGKYYCIYNNGKRTKQYVLRVAAILAFMNKDSVIDAETMRHAVALCTYSLNEWTRYYSEAEKLDSELLLDWLIAQQQPKILKSSINQKAPLKLRNKNARDDALAHLVDSGYINYEKIGSREYVVLNPLLQKAANSAKYG